MALDLGDRLDADEKRGAMSKPTSEELAKVIITDYWGNRWDKGEWLQMAGGEQAWDTIAMLTLKVQELEAKYMVPAERIKKVVLDALEATSIEVTK